jgi:cupin fold WbuC family metalloprotein
MKTSVFYNKEVVTEVGEAWYAKLKRHAYEADFKRARFCLHHDPEDRLHEMVIVFHRDTIIRPHRHTRKSESFHLIFGALDVILFDNDGRPTRAVRMGEFGSGRSQVYRLNGPVWHSVIVHSEYAAIHEVTDGPFRAEDGEYAPWAPTEDRALRAFLARSLDEVLADERVPSMVRA